MRMVSKIIWTYFILYVKPKWEKGREKAVGRGYSNQMLSNIQQIWLMFARSPKFEPQKPYILLMVVTFGINLSSIPDMGDYIVN